MEFLGDCSPQIYQLSTCELRGRYFCVTATSSFLSLTEIWLGRRLAFASSSLGVQLFHGDPGCVYLYAAEAAGAGAAGSPSPKLFDRGPDAWSLAPADGDARDWTNCPDSAYILLSVCALGDKIFVFGLNNRKRPMLACLIDPFHDIYGQPITEITGNPPRVEMLRLTGSSDELDTGSPCWPIDATHIAYSNTGGASLYVLTLDPAAKTLNVPDSPCRIPGGIEYYSAFVPRRDGQVVMLGGYKGSQQQTMRLISYNDGRVEETSLKPFCGRGKNSPGICIYLDRFVIAFGGFYGSYCNEFLVYDLETQDSSLATIDCTSLKPNQWTCMFLKGGFIYLIGGAKSNMCHRVSLYRLAENLGDAEFQARFSAAIGVSAGSEAEQALPPAPELRAWYLDQYRTIMRTYFPGQPAPEPAGDIDFAALHRRVLEARRAARA